MRAKVTILRKGVSQAIEVRPGLGFQAICAKQDVGIEFDCRKADCGICNIKILKGGANLTPATAAEADFLKAMAADPDERLACQVCVMGNVDIEVDYL